MAARPGERRLQILQVLAGMLEAPAAEKITTAALAARLGCSEAALYRHFASKAQMFDGLIDFIESSLFAVINRITTEEEDGVRQVEAVLALLLGFAEKNPGMTRVLAGEALVHEHPRLKKRVDQLLDRIESTLRQSLRIAAAGRGEDGRDIVAAANVLMCYAAGRWKQYAASGFTAAPTALWPQQWALLRRIAA